jgi:putative transcriptional regulator
MGLEEMIEIRLKAILDRKGWTRYKLYRESGVTYSTVSRWQNNKVGDINLEVLEKICRALRCTPTDILNLEQFSPRLKLTYHPFTKIAVTVRHWRESLGMHFQDFADKAGVDYTVLWRWENAAMREINLSVLERFCRALQCSPGDILVLANGLLEDTLRKIESVA